jgi:membrane protein implicated in regulation of membrane protease activity
MFPINDALDAILLGSFFFGLLFTIGSFALGFAEVGIDADVDADAGGDAGDGFFHGLFNLSALLAFITWAGGIGYLARHGLGLWSWAAILVGLLGGIAGAAIVTWFFVKVLRRNSEAMNPADWDIVGVLGRVSSGIRAGGFGEIVYEQQGVRQVAAAKSLADVPIARGEEVVVLRVERGVAIVEPFDDLLNHVQYEEEEF